MFIFQVVTVSGTVSVLLFFIETSELYRCFPAYADHTSVFHRLFVVEADRSSQTGETPAEPFREEV